MDSTTLAATTEPPSSIATSMAPRYTTSGPASPSVQGGRSWRIATGSDGASVSSAGRSGSGSVPWSGAASRSCSGSSLMRITSLRGGVAP